MNRIQSFCPLRALSENIEVKLAPMQRFVIGGDSKWADRGPSTSWRAASAEAQRTGALSNRQLPATPRFFYDHATPNRVRAHDPPRKRIELGFSKLDVGNSVFIIVAVHRNDETLSDPQLLTGSP